jgi:hypothetical protein
MHREKWSTGFSSPLTRREALEHERPARLMGVFAGETSAFRFTLVFPPFFKRRRSISVLLLLGRREAPSPETSKTQENSKNRPMQKSFSLWTLMSLE